MAGLLGVLGLASRGMFIASRGVATAGHNIANADNPEYSRQSQVLSASAPTLHNGSFVGNGVEQVSIQRVNDVFVQLQLVRQASSLGAADAQADALAQIEAVFNEQDGFGLGAGLDQLYRSFSDLASSTTPGAPAERAALRSVAQSLVATIQNLDSQLRDQLHVVNDSIGVVLPQVNQLTRQIQDLNEQIVNAELVAPANDLRDLREARVRDLAQLVDISHFEIENGATVVSLSNGLPLVEGNFARRLVAVPDSTNPFDSRTLNVHYQDGANDIDVSADIGGGTLGGLLRVRETTLPGAIRSLDTIAYNLVSSVNAVHQLGTGVDGTVGEFFAPLGQVEDAARDVAVAGAILANPDSIAAGLTSAPGDNRNALALADLRNGAMPLFLPGDPPGPATGPTATLLEQVSAAIIDVGEQSRGLSASRAQLTRVVEDLETRRDAVSAVSVDEEVAHLVQLQAAFQANARVVSVVDLLIQDVLDLI